MKDAKLWQRVLNNGISRIVPTFDYGRVTDRIISAPQIVDGRPVERVFDLKSVEFTGLVVPFSPWFWTEGRLVVGTTPTLVGSLVGVEKHDAGWHLDLVCLMGDPNRGEPAIVLGEGTIDIDLTGRMIDGTRALYAQVVDAAKELNRRFPEEGAEFHGENFENALLATMLSTVDTLQILGCKNVSLSPREADPELARRAAKRGGGNPDHYRYHVLMVRPAGSYADVPAQEIGVMPRHVCRGHFAEYGPEFGKGLLFGKYAGRFFVPPHVKGDKKNGVVEKDYAIPAGAQ